LASDWYHERLVAKQRHDASLCERHLAYLLAFQSDPSHARAADRLAIADRIAQVRAELDEVRSPRYLESLQGMLGLDPSMLDL